jgi:pyruvate dehydrogenase E2 component (dihydrolipoamide acetyltransferase)
MGDITMPRLSDTMQEGTIAAWLKQPGDAVKKGDVLAEVETDKATMDLTAFESGTLQEILAEAGTTVPIGQTVARIGTGPAAAKTDESASQRSAAEGEPQQAPAAEGQAAEAGTRGTGEAPSAPTDAGSAETPSGGADQPARQAVGEGSLAPSAAGGAGAAPSDADRGAADQGRADGGRADEGPTGTTQERAAPAPDQAPHGPAQAGPNGAAGKVRASPMARHIAAEHGLDLSRIHGSGPLGRVIRADVDAALAAAHGQPEAQTQAPPPAEARTEAPAPAPPAAVPALDGDERVPLSQMRRAIARRMVESVSSTPHFYLTTVVDATDLVALRQQLIEKAQAAGEEVKISVNDLVVRAAALALRRLPEVNVSFAGAELVRHSHVNVGIAVATDRGLIVPVVRDADTKSVGQIAREARDLADRARGGKLQPPDYSGGTFTVSNLGMFGVESFTAVINPPEAAILAVGAVAREPAEHQGQVALRERMRLTLSVDHRVLDGALGARYLQVLKKLLEQPLLLLV